MQVVRKNTNLILSVFIITAALFISYFLVAQALTEADVVFPIAELGNCQDKDECKIYCDESENLDACINFAERYNLMPTEEIRQARKFGQIGVGPGGCTDKNSCDTYCNDITHMDECISFAEAHGLMSREELKEAKKVQAAVARGIIPPAGCNTKESCDIYCSDPEHMEECIEFAVSAGLMLQDELEEAKKVLAVIKKGVKQPACYSKEECDIYCSEPGHMEECMEFAVAAGFMSPDEAEENKKMFKAIEKGIKPPACRGEEECNIYCSQEEHMEECMEFAVAAGLMTTQEAEMSRKTGGKGPGDCKSKEECDVFCEANIETCFDFAKEHGMISEEDLRQTEEGKQQLLEEFTNAPPEVKECLNSILSIGLIEKLKAGTAMPSREIGDAMNSCFKIIGPPEDMPGGPGVVETGAPVGLENAQVEMVECIRSALGEELFKKLEDSRQMPTPDILERINHCFKLVLDQIDWTQMPEDFVGPEGCSTPKECKDYCDSHAAECLTGYVTTISATQQAKPLSEEGMMPPEGEILPPKEGIILPPPEGEYMPPGVIEEVLPPKDIILPPPGVEYMSPEGYPEGDKPPGEIMPPPPTPPQSSIQLQSFLGFVMKPLSGFLGLILQ